MIGQLTGLMSLGVTLKISSNVFAYNFLVDIHLKVIQMQVNLNPFLKPFTDFNAFSLVFLHSLFSCDGPGP